MTDEPGATPTPWRSRRQPTSREFRDAMRCFPSGVTVVTSRLGTDARGMTASSFTSVSLEPLLVLVCLRSGCATGRLVERSGAFAVSVLAADQSPVAAWFADPRRPDGAAQFEPVDSRPGPVAGMPLIAGAATWLECAVERTVEAGDHTVVLGRVLDLGRGETEASPLVFAAGTYAGVHRLEPPAAPLLARAA